MHMFSSELLYQFRVSNSEENMCICYPSYLGNGKYTYILAINRDLPSLNYSKWLDTWGGQWSTISYTTALFFQFRVLCYDSA